MEKLMLILILTFFVSGCNISEQSRTLDQATKALDISPDSANYVLEDIKDPYVLNNRDFARWCMLKSRIADSLKIEVPPVQYLTRAKEWYLAHGNTEDKARISLYLGRSLAQDNEHERAMEAFLQASDLVRDKGNYDLAGYIYSHMADLFVNNNDIIAATQKYNEAAAYFAKGKNQRSYAIAYRNMSKTWAMQDSFALALNCLTIADSIIKNLNEPKAYASVLNHYGNIYSLQGDTKKAEEYLLAALACDTTNSFYNHNVLTELYIFDGQLSKARAILDSLNSLDLPPDYMSSIYYNYYLLHKEEDKIDDALSCLERFMDISDQLLLQEKKLNFVEMEKKYDQLSNYTEIQQLKIERQYYVIAIISFVVILLIGFIIFQRRQIDLKKKVIKQERELNEFNSQCYQLSLELESKKQEIESNLLKQEESSKVKDEILILQEELRNIKRKKLLASDIGKKISRLSSVNIPQNNKSLITEKMWIDIEKEVMYVYPEFHPALYNLSPDLNKMEWRYCCLILFNLTSNQLAVLLNINPESVRKRHLRIRQKLGIDLNKSTLYNYFTEIIQC